MEDDVTPCVGVWIETMIASNNTGKAASHPAWVCGLKHKKAKKASMRVKVTPCVGVWIETLIYANIQANRGHTLRGCVD